MVRFRCLAFHCAQSKRRVSEGILAIICFRLALLGQDRSFIEHSPVGAVCFVPFLTERRLEDHELVLDVRANWPEGSDNKLVFKNASTKYALWERPQVSGDIMHARNYSTLKLIRIDRIKHSLRSNVHRVLLTSAFSLVSAFLPDSFLMLFLMPSVMTTRYLLSKASSVRSRHRRRAGESDITSSSTWVFWRTAAPMKRW